MIYIFLNNAICSSLVRSPWMFRFIHNKPNHYEILKLKNNCTNKEIKEAYIDLSKKYHPDLSSSTNIKKFLDISSAYNILSKPETRRDYDLSLRPIKPTAYYETITRRNPMDDPAFYRNRDRRQDYYYEQRPYYGIKGVQRVSNSIIMMACLLFMTIGVTIQVMAIRHSFTLKRNELLIRSAQANTDLEKSRQAAESNGNKVQIALLEEKFRKNDASYSSIE